jgi:carotenoid cleavage dioxygenase
LDLKTGKESSFYVGELQGLQEPCFVPRKGGTEEGDGYALCTVSNYESMTSDVVIVDAKRMEEDAIATIKLPFRLRSGTHTNWFSSSDLPLAT